MDVIMEAPDDDPVFIKQPAFFFICSVLRFFEPVLLIASVPEQSFMSDDEVGSEFMSFSDA